MARYVPSSLPAREIHAKKRKREDSGVDSARVVFYRDPGLLQQRLEAREYHMRPTVCVIF